MQVIESPPVELRGSLVPPVPLANRRVILVVFVVVIVGRSRETADYDYDHDYDYDPRNPRAEHH
jgi:hypothetical protein